jgi:hypothetical protein
MVKVVGEKGVISIAVINANSLTLVTIRTIQKQEFIHAVLHYSTTSPVFAFTYSGLHSVPGYSVFHATFYHN